MNTLNEFVRLNLSNDHLFRTFNSSDRKRILDTLFNRPLVIQDANQYLNGFTDTGIKKNVLRNYKIAENRQITRNSLKNPTSGDVLIDDNGNKFRIVSRHPEQGFIFCTDGSFYMGESGGGLMSGSFCDIRHGDKEIYSISADKLTEVKTSAEYRKFWFFMDNSSGGHKGLYFNCPVRTWKIRN